MNGKFYILTTEQANAYEKETLKYSYSLYQMMTDSCKHGGTGTDDDICGIVDSIMSDVARVVARQWAGKENFIPYTGLYPEMVCREVAGLVENVQVVLHDDVADDEQIASMTLRNNIWHISYGYNSWYDVRWDPHPLHSIFHFASNIITCGYGEGCYCLKPDIAARLFLILDDMTGYLREELKRIYYRVRKEMMCRQVEMNSVLAAVKEAGFKYYRLWVNSTRTVALNVKLSGNREVDVTLYPRHINGMLDVLIEDLKLAEKGGLTELPCRIYEASGNWNVIE